MNPKSTTKPVFYDPHQRRWRHFSWTLRIGLAFIFLIFGLFTISLFITPNLPTTSLSSVVQKLQHTPPPPALSLDPEERLFQTEKQKLANYLIQMPRYRQVVATPTAADTSKVMAFMVNWDDNSFTSLRRNIGNLDVLVPEWLHLGSTNTITQDNPDRQKEIVDYIHTRRPDLSITPLINNFNSDTNNWDGTSLANMIDNSDSRQRTVNQLYDFVSNNHFQGINIDFEDIPNDSQTTLVEFMHELYNKFHSANLTVSMDVPLDNPNFDYPALGKNVDYLILMAYDQHWGASTAGPIASQQWFSASLSKRFKDLPPQKYIIAVGNYGYDWVDKSSDAAEITFQEAIKTAQDSSGQIAFDPLYLNPYYDYYDDHNTLHHVWYLDALTVYNQVLTTSPFKPGGFALWRMGSEDPSTWTVFKERTALSSDTAEKLQSLTYGYDLDYEGKGEILKVTQTAKDGSRSLSFDNDTKLINKESLTNFPAPYTITRWGGSDPKKIALTFDDGPDKNNTPQILDILKKNNVPGTFFVIGMNADLNNDILQRMYKEGHEIGNHTFTHPNISFVGNHQLMLELNSTQRLLESRLGHNTLLFRPPYAEDVEPETPDQVKPLIATSDMGYYTIGMQVDPSDWATPGVDKIVQNTVSGVESGLGNVVLLHDGGGDRTQTIEALPQIISKLKQDGYQFVLVSDLMGLSRDQVMPATTPEPWYILATDQLSFLVVDSVGKIIGTLFLAGICLGIARFVLIGLLAIIDRLRNRRRKYNDQYLPTVSVIIPAYNEAKVINKTVQSLLTSSYPNLNIVVVDDGSTDNTYQVLKQTWHKHKQVKLLTKTNGGKAAALNFGIEHTDAEIIIGLDADTIFHKNTISHLIRHFSNPRVGAVAGNAKVGNRINILTRWQALEYVISQNLDRRAFELLNCITVVPGAVGAWRRKLILQAGGFSHDTLAEDADLTISILRLGYKIEYDGTAIALTEAPDTFGGFIKQRFRWTFGTLQSAWKHRDTLFRPQFGTLGLVGLPNIFVFQIFFPLISPFTDLMFAVSLIEIGIVHLQHPEDPVSGSIQKILWFYLLFLVLEILGALIAFVLERKENWKLLFWLIPQRLLYRQLMYYVVIKSALVAIKGSVVGWGKLERKATVTIPKTLHERVD